MKFKVSGSVLVFNVEISFFPDFRPFPLKLAKNQIHEKKEKF